MFGAIAGGIASALAGGAMSKLFGGGQKAASGGIQGDVLATDNNTVGMGDAGIKSAIQGSNVPNPDEAVPSFVSGAMAKAGKGLLEGTLQAGTSAVSDKLLDLVGLGGKSAADKGKDTRDYLAAAFPELNAWERAGADASSAGMVDAGFENQKELTKMQLDNQKEIAEMQNETQKEIAGIQSATSRQNTKDQVYAQNEMLAYQQKESTARVASIMENTNLSKQQQVSEIMRQMLTQAQTAGQYFTNDQIKEMTRKVSAEVDLVHQQTQNQRYGSSHIGATAKDISNVVTDAASGVVDIFHGIDKAVADTWNNFWKDGLTPSQLYVFMPPNLGGFFMRIEALKPAIEACGISTLSQSPMLGFHKQMDNRIKLLEEILSFRMQGVEFDNGDMYVDGHKAASDVRDEFVSVTEKLMDELAQCYNVLPQLDINNTIDHRPEGDEKWFLENEKTVTQFCRKLAAERPLKDIRDEYNYPKKKGIKDECSRLLEASTMKSRRGFAIQRLMNAMRQAHADEAFYDNPNALRDYFRDIGRMVLAAEGRKANDSHADCYQYFCVPEYGTANGRLHFHAVHFMRTLPTGSVDPNFGRRFATRRTLFHVLVGCGLLMLKTALASIKLIQASAVLDLTEDDFDFLTSNKVWIATDRSRARRCVEACVYGTLDFVGYPRFPAPVEFIAAVIAYYVHPVNIQTACLIMEGAEFTENIINGVERPVKAAELFAFTLRVRAGNTDVLTDAEENWIKFMKDGVNATPLPTVNTTGYIDHAAFLGTINPDTNKIPKHLFQGYLNIYNNYFKAPWMPDRTEANPNELNQDDARYGFRCCHLKNIWTAPLPPETELSRQMTTSTTSIDIMGLQAAYANLHTDQERDYFMQRYHDVISSFGGKTSYDADNRPLLVMRSNLWASGYDVDGTDQTSLGQFSGRVQQTYKHSVPRFFVPEHGTMFTLALVRFPPTATKEIQYLNAKGALTYTDIAGDPVLYGNLPPREISMKDVFRSGDSSKKFKIAE
ncbi:unnamed protein product, partial [Rhizoctonia solani]